MRRNGFRRLLVVVIHAELFLLIHGIGHLAAHDHALVEHEIPQRLAQIGVFADPLGHDVARAFQSFVHTGDAALFIHKLRGKGAERHRGVLLCPQVLRQGLQALFPGNGRLGAPLGFERQVQVLEFVFVESCLDARLQFIGKLALLRDGGEDGFAPVCEIAEIRQLLLDGADLHLVEIAGRLLAIARDEGDRAAVVQQFDNGADSANR